MDKIPDNHTPPPGATGPQKISTSNPWNPSASKHQPPFPEPPLYGINVWVFNAFIYCYWNGFSAREAEAKIRSYGPQLRRPFRAGEVERAVARAYGQTKPKAGRRDYTPKWDPAAPEAIQAAIRTSEIQTLQQLTDLSDPVPTEGIADHVIDALFPGNPLLCFAREGPWTFLTVPREEARGELEDVTLVVPSSMTAPSGVKADGSGLSEHTLDNTGPREYLVVESDSTESFDQQAAIIGHLKNFMPLVCVAYSGNRSLHAWFKVGGLPEANVRRFFAYAVVLGADPRMWLRSQFARLPGGWNYDKNARQTIHYFKPGAAMDTLPALPGSSADFQWELKDAAVEWTRDPLEIDSMSAPPIIEGLLRDGDAGTVVGGAKTHKTWIVLHLAICVALGISFLGRKVWQRRVLCLDYELKEQTFRKRLSMLSPSAPQGLHYQAMRGTDRLPTMNEIEELIIDEKIGLVILDPLYRTELLREENSNDSTGRDLMALQNLATHTGAAVLVVDHTAKGGGNERSAVDAARGASAKGGFFDSIMVLRPKPSEDSKTSLVVLDAVVRDWAMPPDLPVAALHWDGTTCTVELAGTVARDEPSMIIGRIIECLEAAKEPLSIKDICDAIGIPETTARNSLKKLVAAGRIGHIQDPRHSQRLLYRAIVLPTEIESGSEGHQ